MNTLADTILRFPDRFVGVIHSVDPVTGKLERLCNAEGTVAVPADALLHVVALRGECLAPLLPAALRIDGLEINKTQTTDDDLAPVASFVNLRYLNASKARQIGDAGIRHLSGLSKLEHLDLYASKVTDAGLPSLANLVSLTYLHLGLTRVDGRGLPALRGLRRLARLSVEERPIDDTALAGIDCPGLKKLVAFGTRVTAAGVEAFRLRFPQCEVVGDVAITEKSAQEAAGARFLLTRLIRRLVVGHPLKADHGDAAVVEVLERVFPGGSRLDVPWLVERGPERRQPPAKSMAN